MISPSKGNREPHGPHSWRRRASRGRVARVAAISTDQLVPCPRCGDPMKLFHMDTFECRACDRTIATENVFTALQQDEA